MGNSQAALLDRTAMLMSKDDDEKTTTLAELYETLDPSDRQTNKARSQAVLDNKAVMDVLLNLSATTRSADVVKNALGVLLRLAYDRDNGRRLFQEHPSLVPVVMRKFELGAENAPEEVQMKALSVLSNLAFSVDNAREMVTKNPALVSLLVAKVESNLEQVQVRALNVLRGLARNVDNKRTMVTNNPTLVPLLVAKMESNLEQVQEGALSVLYYLAIDADNAREMATTNSTLVPLLVTKVESNLEQVQVGALGVLQDLALNVVNTREMVTKNLTLVPLLVAKVESNSEQVQAGALGVLSNLVLNADNESEMVTKNPTLVPLLMAKVEFNSEKVQVGALGALQNLAVNVDNKREMVIKNPALISLLVTKVESNSEQVQVGALSVLQNLARNDDNARDMATKNPTLVPLLLAKVESDLKKVQVASLGVLSSLAICVDNNRKLFTNSPTLVPLLMIKMESNSERVHVVALGVLNNLARNDNNVREMVTQHPMLVSLLAAKVESNSEQVQVGALGVLSNLTTNVDNAQEILANYAEIIFLLVAKMSESTALLATKVVYNLSCSPANRVILRGNDSVVAALTKGRKDKDKETSFFSLLALVNLFGAEEDSEVLTTDLAMLQVIFNLIARAMNKEKWDLNNPLLAFRYLCVVEHNRQLLWDKYGSKFLTSVLAALQRAIDEKDIPAMENAMSTLAQFSSDTEPLAWMRSNKPEMDEVIAQLAPYSEAQRTAQFLLLTVDPPKVAAAPVQVAGSKPTIMISYNWKHQAQARLIHSLLDSQDYPVWRDEEHMKADILDAMADAVNKSTVVLVLVSPSYKESANCQMECKFAHNSNRKLIPVLVEPGYIFKADGWMGLLLGSKLYYDLSGFHNEAQMKPVVLDLLRREVEGGLVVATAAPPVAVVSPQPVSPPIDAVPMQPAPPPVTAVSPQAVPPPVAAVSMQPTPPPIDSVPVQSAPQNEADIRQWLSTCKHGEEIADKLVKEGFVEAEDLEALSKKNAAELKPLVGLNGKQALALETALKELFAQPRVGKRWRLGSMCLGCSG